MKSEFRLVFNDIFTSSVWEEEPHVRLLWIYFIVSRDQHGEVYGTNSGLARMVNLSVEQIEDALRVLSSPDPESTSSAEEGRRIVWVSNNRWRVVNHEHYSSLDNLEKKRAAHRVAQEKYRNGPEAPAEGLTVPAMVRFNEFWAKYPHVHHDNKAAAQALWAKLNAAVQARCLTAVELYRRYLEAQDRLGTKYVKKASNWLRDAGWDSDWVPPKEQGAGKGSGSLYTGMLPDF
jgi:hypothetical protein